MSRDMRGASYMDQYDSNYGNNTYDTTKRDSNAELTGCTKYVFIHFIFYYVIFHIYCIQLYSK